MPLTASKITAIKRGPKPQKYFDGRGLFLLVEATGNYKWRYKYRFAGKETSISLGLYPEVSLKLARQKRDEARMRIGAGVNPARERKDAKVAAAFGNANTFKAVSEEWLATRKPRWSEAHFGRESRRLQLWAYSDLGSTPINAISVQDVSRCLKKVQDLQKIETAHRVLSLIQRVFTHARLTGRLESNPTLELRGSLVQTNTKGFAAITDEPGIRDLLRAIEAYDGSVIVKLALRLAPLVFVRPGELRRAEWAEFDLAKARWEIPASKMKGRRAHVVPLSKQALAVLDDARRLTGDGRYVFPGLRSRLKPLSDAALLNALRRMGYGPEAMTVHGFRKMASTRLHSAELFPSDAIERQLAHQEGNAIKAIYNFSTHIETRTKMMQWWADYLDKLGKSPSTVTFLTVPAAA